MGLATGAQPKANLLLAFPNVPWILDTTGKDLGFFLVQDGSTPLNQAIGSDYYFNALFQKLAIAGPTGLVQWSLLPPIPALDPPGHQYPIDLPATDPASNVSVGIWAPIKTDKAGMHFPLYRKYWKNQPLGSATPNEDHEGMGIVALSVRSIEAFLMSIYTSDNAVLLICEANGSMVAASVPDQTQIGNTTERYSATSAPNPLIQQTARYLAGMSGGLAGLGHRFGGSFESSMGTTLVSTRRLQDSGGLNWILILSAPQSDFTGTLSQTQKTIIIAIVVTAVTAAAISAGVAYALVYPIRRLCLFMEQATDFDFSAVRSDFFAKKLTLDPREIVICKKVFLVMLTRFATAVQSSRQGSSVRSAPRSAQDGIKQTPAAKMINALTRSEVTRDAPATRYGCDM
ncbi:uncharacterized protein EV422DRAFT_208978 [Fimicolochytrium jonesii]|uniref:uncharacterized protein n=1 Tax=Fimicolochytrium jonesii TaxID=1396493 RepID=UPI0022FE7997|nr:uncharacterized protein EV422DRAFT_208978 [Fimicolochytrium jonesii]KAI8817868.1 hypothetical protein EV422DRAFT_208978 [Fimicolochytrium jonesii]